MDEVLDELLASADHEVRSSLVRVLNVMAGLGAILGCRDKSFVAGSILMRLEPTDRKFLLNLGVLRSSSAGEVLMHQGDSNDQVLVIVSGWVRIYCSTPGNQDILVALRGPGDVIGDQAALHGSPHTATVQAIDKVEVMRIQGEQFTACLEARPKIAIAMLRQIAERLREADRRRMAFATLDVAQRVANFLIHLMDVHGTVEQGGIVVRMPLTQQDIADSIGASRRAVARALASLKEQGILNTGRREFVVVRPDVLAMFKRAETPAALRR